MFVLALNYYAGEARKKRHLVVSLFPLTRMRRFLRDLSSRVFQEEMTSEIDSTRSNQGCILRRPEFSWEICMLAAG